jgi:protein-S-isoprenylcysteine O-methyltransferase Ste14
LVAETIIPSIYQQKVSNGDAGGRAGGLVILRGQVKELRVNHVEAFWGSGDSVVFPRLIPLSVLVIAVASLLQLILPIDILADIEFVEDIAWVWPATFGLALGLGGLALSLAGHAALARRGADVERWQPATVLVVDGVFQWTRNPAYLGMLIALAGIAMVFSLDWLVILIVPLWLFLDAAVVRPEEFRLEQRFGRAYQVYARRAPRYLFIH